MARHFKNFGWMKGKFGITDKMRRILLERCGFMTQAPASKFTAKGRWSPVTTYRAETREILVLGKKLTVVGMTPEHRAHERQAVKREIESTLYEVFRKYVSTGN